MEFGQASMTAKSHRILPLDVRTELVPIQDFDEVVGQCPKTVLVPAGTKRFVVLPPSHLRFSVCFVPS